MKQIIIGLIFILIALNCSSQNDEEFHLWPGNVPGETGAKHPALPAPTAKNGILLVTDVTDPVCTVFRPSPLHNNRIGIVICPGGGNKYLSTITEGKDVGKWFTDRGYTAFVLQYRVPDKRAGALQDIMRALRLIRFSAEKWKLDVNKIGVMGFSAGGNLSARASTEFTQKTYLAVDKADSLSCRPDFAVLIYPGGMATGPEHKLITELTVDQNTSPTFLFVANDDPIGIPLSYAYALHDAKVPMELHVFPNGGHGFGLARGNGLPWEWPELADKWIKQTLTIDTLTKKTVWLSSLDLTKMIQGTGKPMIDKNTDQKPLTIAKQVFKHGVGTRVNSSLWLDLGGVTDRFIANIGVDDDTTRRARVTTHNFKIIGDGKKLWESGPMNYGDSARKVDIDVKGTKTLILFIFNIGSRASQVQLDWADARFVFSGRAPVTISPPKDEFVILTPKPGPEPRINGPKVYGCRPGNPFLYCIPVTGERPIQYSVKNLPVGLSLDPATGIITGTISQKGEYQVTLNAKNKFGKDSRLFKICCGDLLALTPPMGWNDWYAHYSRITDKMMRQAADIIVSSGMADVGYQYVNIDDCWMNAKSSPDSGRIGPARTGNGKILSNSYFPDMNNMTDYIHSKGLKAGLYTSPGVTTCAGYTGSYLHEAQDAKQFADWGFDFLKYDRCSYGNGMGTFTVEMEQKPYLLMGNLLKEQKRDIVYNLCQYGRSEVWKWGAEVGGNSWRTGGDLGFGLDRIFDVALKNAEYGPYSKPGAWNDPDYIQIGYVGNANGGGLPVPSKLTPTEQYSFMSLWCLLAAPLFYSGDLTQMDAFTRNVLCNPEVIEVDQDPLGKCARVIQKNDDSFIMIKDIEDGSKAVGFCNGGETPVTITLKWSVAGIQGEQIVRDLWRQKNIGTFKDEFTTTVPRHGVTLVKISKHI